MTESRYHRLRRLKAERGAGGSDDDVVAVVEGKVELVEEVLENAVESPEVVDLEPAGGVAEQVTEEPLEAEPEPSEAVVEEPQK